MVVRGGGFREIAPGGVGAHGEDRGPARRRAEDHLTPIRRALPRKGLPGPLLFVVVAAAYLALAQFVLALNDPVKLGAGFWPAAGVTLGVLLLLPTRRWGWVVAAVGLAELGGDLAHGYPVGASLWWTAANCIEPLVGATLIRRYGDPRGALVPIRNLLLFLAFGVVVGPLVGGTIGSIGTVTGLGSPIWQVWPKFVVGDGLGVLVVAPVLLTWRAPMPRRSLAERAVLATALVALTTMAFRNWSGSWDVAMPYFIVPLLTWAALRLGVRGTAGAVFVVTQIANWATANGYGPFAMAGGPDGHAITLLQGFLAITAASAFIVAALVSDLSTRDDVERRLTAQAEHDTLTGLPNRAWIGRHLDAILDDARRAGRRVVLFVCDLDRFKVVNDSLGHQIGDQLIVQIGERMRHSVRPGDVVARLGGDEFVVILDDPADDVIDAVASRILEAVSEPLRLERATELTPSVSLGVAISSRDATAETLLRDADAALYRSKAAGRGSITRFDTDLRTAVLDRLMIESELRPALANGDITCDFQPEIVLATGELFGFEALSRWHHPERGTIAPLNFVPVAESTGVAPALFTNALECALAAQAQWADVLGPATSIAVNLSPMQLHDPTLVPALAELLARFGAPPDSLWLEVTEDALADLPGLPTLEGLRDLGVHMAIDDFGIGWSSMARLGAFPWDLLKIDRSFIADLGLSPQADHIVQAMVYMAHALGMRTVAEGVERPDQLRRLREIGCDIVQGYAIARPLSTDDVPDWGAAQGLRWRAPA